MAVNNFIKDVYQTRDSRYISQQFTVEHIEDLEFEIPLVTRHHVPLLSMGENLGITTWHSTREP